MPKAKLKVKDAPDGLKPFLFHGMDLNWSDGADQAKGECPWCAKEKFHVNVDSGLWDCKVCGLSGNPVLFLRALWELSDGRTTSDDHASLMRDRGLVLAETTIEWGLVRSALSGEWLIPGYTVDGLGERKLMTLYAYKSPGGGEGRKLYVTPGTTHYVILPSSFDPSKPVLQVCEGPWDAMTMWEAMRSSKAGSAPDSLNFTANAEASLLHETNVIAVPSCSSFPPGAISLAAGKAIVLMYDNDYPKDNPTTGASVEPAGYAGMKRAAQSLAEAEAAPLTVSFLSWGEGNHNPALADGFDVRDALAGEEVSESGRKAKDYPRLLGNLLSFVRPIPEDWVAGRSKATARSGGVELSPLACTTYQRLTTACRKALKWTEGLDRAFSIMLAALASTKSAGDQVWLKIIGPPGAGKSELCEALSTNKKHVLARSVIRGFHSGFRGEKGEGAEEDCSLIQLVRGRTLITKDADTLLQAPNIGQILSEARDVYDRVSRTHYRNRVSREYENVSMTWILCGTSALRVLDKSELGARFLDCVIMEGVDREIEDEVMARKFSNMQQAIGIEMNGTPESSDVPAKIEMKRLSAGYVNHLRERAHELVKKVRWPANRQQELVDLARFVSYIRARPSEASDESAERELGTRLLGQLGVLAGYLAVVLNRDSIDDEVMRRVRRVAMDTARGWTLQIARHLHEAGADVGMEAKGLAAVTGHSDEETKKLLRFLRRIDAVESFRREIVVGLTGAVKYRLTEDFRELYARVIDCD